MDSEYQGKIYLRTENGYPLYRVNELELIKDPVTNTEYIWGNIFQENWIVKINPQTGYVEKRYNMKVLDDIQVMTPQEEYPKLASMEDRTNNVLNGIAYDS